MSRDFSSPPVIPGRAWRSSAAAPATCGVAIEVPDIVASPPPVLAALMSTPGAVTSGLTAPSAMIGPLLENSASLSCLSTAPTVSASGASPGLPTQESQPSLPAAITKSVPYWRVRVETASVSGPPASGLPRLMLTTSARFSPAAHSMPSMIQESWP